MRAGKDVHVEEPLARTVTEGLRVLDAAATYSRIFQTGPQRRPVGAYWYAYELVRNGGIGRPARVEAGITGINPGVQVDQSFPTGSAPEGLDHDRWLGPAPVLPLSYFSDHGDAMYLPTISLTSKRRKSEIGPLVGQRGRAYNSRLCSGVVGRAPDAEMSFELARTTEG